MLKSTSSDRFNPDLSVDAAQKPTIDVSRYSTVKTESISRINFPQPLPDKFGNAQTHTMNVSRYVHAEI